jgi:ribonuclease HI
VKQLSLFAADSASSHDSLITTQHWTLYIDGAARNNPGPAGAGIYLINNGQEVEKAGYFLGIKTNNQAEYLALLVGILTVQRYKQSQDTVQIVSDSQLLVRQLQGAYRVKNQQLLPLYKLGRALLLSLHAQIIHVLRSENVVADEMANEGIDRKIPIPPDFIKILQQHEIPL